MKKSTKAAKQTGIKALVLEVRQGRYTLVGDGKELTSSPNKWYVTSKKDLYMTPSVTKYEDRTSKLAGQSSLDVVAQDNPALNFPIDQRFDYLEQLVMMVAEGKMQSAIVTGPGGLGKTFTVLSALKKAGRKDISDMPYGVASSSKMFRVIKGFSTVKGLFDSLKENKDGLLIFDDCDSAFDDADAANLLKAALDSYDKRVITWNKSASFGTDGSESFVFTGGIIFISNKSQVKIDQAVRTRAVCVDVSMTVEQIITRMKQIMKAEMFLEHVSVEHKNDAMALIEELKDNIKNLSLRSLILACKIRAAKGDKEWKPLASFSLLSAA